MISFGSPTGTARGSDAIVLMRFPLNWLPMDHNTKRCGEFPRRAIKVRSETICSGPVPIGDESMRGSSKTFNCGNLASVQRFDHDLVWCEGGAQVGNTTRKPC